MREQQMIKDEILDLIETIPDWLDPMVKAAAIEAYAAIRVAYAEGSKPK